MKQVVQLGTENVSVSESGVGWMQVMQDKLHLGQMMPGLPEPGDAGTLNKHEQLNMASKSKK